MKSVSAASEKVYAVEMQGISKYFGSFCALNGVQLRVEKGSIHALLGENGAGKSTMLNAVAGTWQVDGGQIIIDGIDVTKLSEHKRAAYLGRVFQDPMTGTATTMSIEENMAIAARRGRKRGLSWGITKAERDTLPLQNAVAKRVY